MAGSNAGQANGRRGAVKRFPQARRFEGRGLFLGEQGEIRARGGGVVSPGGPVAGSVEIECEGCGHCWHPRRRFAGTAL